MTNLEKFVEVFGFKPRTDNCPDLSPKVCQQQKDCNSCPFDGWWDKEYKSCFRMREDFDDGK